MLSAGNAHVLIVSSQYMDAYAQSKGCLTGERGTVLLTDQSIRYGCAVGHTYLCAICISAARAYRDLTINALFYNINTGTVEDFTGKGLTDLSRGLISTPLPATTTLLDDPLRVMRSIRFASRLGFDMSPELLAACKDPAVHCALAQKVRALPTRLPYTYRMLRHVCHGLSGHVVHEEPLSV